MVNTPNHTLPEIHLEFPPEWKEYQLIDSGDGLKLERYGNHVLIRPEPEAIWKPTLPGSRWQKANATFIPGKGEEIGSWQLHQPTVERWQINFHNLQFWMQLSNSRHIGIFPEQASQWQFIEKQVKMAKNPIKVLNLFGYTGIASLAAAYAGAQVTHVDASQKAIHWARDNQVLSGLQNKPIRWIVDDALKFVRREIRRNNRYDGIILDPPKFGRGPRGEVWEFYKLLPLLLDACTQALSIHPRFLLLTAYAVKASAITLYELCQEMMSQFQGKVIVGELLLKSNAGGQFLSRAIFASWTNEKN